MFPLSHRGVLGLNARTLLYIKPFNPKKATALADSKLKTKAYLAAREIPVAKLYGRIESRDQLLAFDFAQLPDECVLKPNHGFGGEGIIVLKGRDKQGRFLRNGKNPIEEDELREHIEDILDGKFSLKGMLDTAFFEQILKPHSCFARFRPVGLPDIRVIVFNLVPVMAMVRIPTADSDGKANIHLGGIGIGIDIAKGTTTYAAQYHSMIEHLPHGEVAFGHPIPYWDDILLVCSKIQQITNIGYLAVDITIDEQIGPALLEVNARAGLEVQVANLAPLRARLERVGGIKVENAEKGVRMGQDLFGSKARKTTKKNAESEKPTLGIKETVSFTLSDQSTMEVDAVIASEKERTALPSALLKTLLEKKIAEQDETEGLYRMKFTLGGKKIQTVVKENRDSDSMTIGARDLSGFLIDPSKKKLESSKKSTVKKLDLRGLDRIYGQIDKDLLILKHIKPINLQEESDRLQGDPLYNPTFVYSSIDTNIEEAEKKLQQKITDDSALGILLEKKRGELLTRIKLLRARGNNEEYTKYAKQLYGSPSAELLHTARTLLAERTACEASTEKPISAEEAQIRFEEVLKQYALHNWHVSIRQKLVSRITVGGNKIYIRNDARFSEEDIASLIAHEIETHVLTSENGSHQPYHLLRRGPTGYLDTQEGLAIYNERRVLAPIAEKVYNPIKNILALEYSLGHSLAQTRTYLQAEMGLSPERALRQSISMKRGLGDTSTVGGFTKSISYFRGILAIEKFIEEGGDIKRLYIGKVALEDLDLIENLPNIKAPLILPTFLR